MTKTVWQTLGEVDPKDVSNVRLHVHDRLQWLARIARSYTEAVPDDSHTALTWEPARSAFATQPIQRQQGKIRFLFDPIEMALLTDAPDLGALPLGDIDGEHAETAVRQFLKRAGLDDSQLQTALPYDSELSEHVPSSSKREREELKRYFENFDALLKDKLTNEPGASAVRIWPHHFDLAVLILIDQTGNDRSIGVGFSPGDGSYAEPYLYVTPWPYPDAGNLPAAPAGLVWHTEGFTALIGTASDVFVGDPSRGAFVAKSLEDAIPLCRNLLNAF